MLIVCKTCASSYHIPREILGENGCRLRCVGCGEAWTVAPETMAANSAPIGEGERLPALPPTRGRFHHSAPRFIKEKNARRGREAGRRNLGALKRVVKIFAIFLAL